MNKLTQTASTNNQVEEVKKRILLAAIGAGGANFHGNLTVMRSTKEGKKGYVAEKSITTPMSYGSTLRVVCFLTDVPTTRNRQNSR